LIKYSKSSDFIASDKEIRLSPYLSTFNDWVCAGDFWSSIHSGRVKLPAGKRRKPGTLELEDTPAPHVADARTAKLAEMRKECGDHIDAGFECDALGYPCQYHNSVEQQITMRNAAVSGGKIWRNEAFTLHTQVEAQEVFAESMGEIERLRTVYANKCTYINDESRTVAEIEAVTWDSAE
jgi:hypothetical protein